MYTDKQENRQGTLSEDVVLQLISKINLVEHKLFFDNFFRIISLLLQPKKEKIGAIGTIRTNRKRFPEKFLQKGKTKYQSLNGKTRNRYLLQVIRLIQEKLKRLLEEKKVVQLK
jgi:hypothetical protein